MTAPNPLVAAPGDVGNQDGAGVVDSVWTLADEVKAGDAAGIAVQGAGVGLEALGAIVDPIGAMAAAGVGWLIEHVEPLRWPLDQLAGDPRAIEAVSETWHNIAAEMRDIGEGTGTAAASETAQWTGEAGEAYRRKAAELAAEIGAMEAGASGVAGAVTTGGVLVGVVRGMVRDLVAECVGQLISKALMALASSWFTLGGSVGAFVAWAVGKVGITIGKIAQKISDLLDRLGDLLGRLGRLGGTMGDLAQRASRFTRVQAVKVDDFASIPGRWVNSGADEGLADTVNRNFDRFRSADEATRPSELQVLDDAGNLTRPHLDPNLRGDGIKVALESAKGAEKGIDTYDEQQHEARNP